ncbi:zinc finger protein rotund isoform X4 [Cylas formicarius]|uniref:zinc finger protein rotund isoform X4 n=1 Tax=Cylas formicarius TaxID=197179 RepID=UPI002958DC1B|nr:zinc finger protein rotund isoform X4 [Cylas formicarius]
MLLENNTNYSSHLQRSIDTLRSLGDRLGDRDLRLNLHQDYHHRNNNNNQPINNGMELNLSLNSADRLLHERMQQERSLERLLNERTMQVEPRVDHSLTLERLNLERSLTQSLDRNLNLGHHHHHHHHQNNERPLMDRNLNSDLRNLNNIDTRMSPYAGTVPERLRDDRDPINDLKYREYKAHLENLNRESSRSLEGGGGGGGVTRGAAATADEGDRGATPSTPPTPISVGENFHEEKVFSSKAELQLHTQAHMREAKPYKCSQCCKAFANSSYLSQHTRIHLGIKPYRCEICQRKFTQLSHLQQHIRTHTGDKPYKCRHPGCQKAFSQLSNLQSHSRCHQTDKPYKCNSCYKCFSDEPSLLEHIPKHKESKHLKTHICQYCGKSYTQETYLQKHMQKHAERTDKRPPIGPTLDFLVPGLNHRGLDHPYWPKVSPDSAENMHDYPTDIPRGLLEQNEDLVIIRQQLSQNPPAPPGTPNANLGNSYDTSISKSNTNSAFTPINSMSGHLNHLNQLAPNRPYIYDALSFQNKNSLDIPKSQPSNGFPNQLISLHQIRNYAHQPNASLMEHSILGGLKDK